MSGWEPIAERPGGSVYALTSGEAEVLALTPAAIFRSSNAGASWLTLPLVEATPPLYAMAQMDCGLTFVGGADGLWRSTDGHHWRQVLGGEAVLTVAAAADSKGGAIVLVGTETDGVLRSEDGGATWSSANPGLLEPTVLALALSPCFGEDGLAFAGTPTGLFRTRNGGRSWRELPLPVPEPAIQAITLSPRFGEDRLVLIGTEADGLLSSRDGGDTWAVCPDLSNGGIAATAISKDARVLAVGDEDGVFLSSDGSTWRQVGHFGPVLSLAFARDVLLVGVAGEGVLWLAPGAETWQASGPGLHGRLTVALAATSPGELWTGDLEEGVARSCDGGYTWTPVNDGLSEPSVSALAVGARGELLAAATTGLYQRTPADASWRTVDANAASVAVAASSDGAALAAMADGRLLVRSHAGQWSAHVWDAAARGSLASVAAAEGVLFVGASGSAAAVWRSLDVGATWEPWLRSTRSVRAIPLSVSPSYRVDGRVVVGLVSDVLHPIRGTRERRHGDSLPLWRASPLPAAAARVTALAFAHNDARCIFAATTTGISVSRDAGDTFADWSEDLPRAPYLSVRPIGGAVFALGVGGTIWRREVTWRTMESATPEHAK